ncbi:MAG: hypothetical protein KGI51_11465, partial [Rhodospirillales bacterium]|nr:hypothetical protein [Rhodospirillales bacterium]
MPSLRFPRSSVAGAAALALALIAPPALAGTAAPRQPGPLGADAAYLDGSFALSAGDPGIAAGYFARALAARPADPLLLRRAFAAALMAGRPEAAGFARRLTGD